MFINHYIGWIASRMNGINKYILPNYFASKTLLELGAGYAHIGNHFHNLGAIVTSSDARKEHLDVANQLYPHIPTYVFDGDNDIIDKKYDIIVHWGLLYHLKEIENHLAMVSLKCNILLLETEVSDSADDSYTIRVDEEGFDQAKNLVGNRPSPAYVEKVLKNNGFQFKLIKDPILNSDPHTYDWDMTNNGERKIGLRRFWICWKDTDSPLIHN